MTLARAFRDRRHSHLARRAGRGDTAAFEALYRELFTPVWRYVASRLREGQSAEDVVSIVFHRFLESLGRFDPERGSVTTWLLTIAHHAIVDQLRRQRRTVPIEELERELAASSPSPLEVVLHGERQLRLEGALRELPEQTRSILDLRYGQELDYREIAALTGLSAAVVRQRVSRVLRSLRTRFRGAADGEEEVEGGI